MIAFRILLVFIVVAMSSLAEAGLFMPCCAEDSGAEYGDDHACQCVCPSFVFVVQSLDDLICLDHGLDLPASACLGLPQGIHDLPVRPPIAAC